MVKVFLSNNNKLFNLIINYFFQDRDLKQYMDDCGNIMSMNNVKVRDTRYIGQSP